MRAAARCGWLSEAGIKCECPHLLTPSRGLSPVIVAEVGIEKDVARYSLKPPEGQLAVDRLRIQVRNVVEVADELDAVVHDSE